MDSRFVARAEEEVWFFLCSLIAKDAVDPRIAVREHCKESHCPNFAKELEACNARVASKTKTTETCTQELFDLLHCVDHCVRMRIYQLLCLHS